MLVEFFFKVLFLVYKLFLYDLKGETYIEDFEKWFKTKAFYVFICSIIHNII